MINPSQTAESGKPRRPWYHWVAILAGLFIVLLGVPLAILDITGRAALQRELDAIRVAGGPINFEQLQASLIPLPDDQNGALVLLALTDRIETLQESTDRDKLLPIIGEADLPAFGEPYPPEVVAAIDDLIAKQGELLAELDLLHALPKGRRPLKELNVDTVFPHLGPIRTAAKLKYLHALNHLAQGDLAKANRDVVTMLNIAGAVAQEPIVISFLVAVATQALAMQAYERILATGVLADGDLLALSKKLRGVMETASPVRAMWGERLWHFSIHELFAKDPAAVVEFIDASGPVKPLAGFYRFMRGWRFHEAAKTLQLMGPLCDVQLTPRDYILRSKQHDTANVALPGYYILTRTIMPSLSKAMVYHARRVATLRCAYVAIGVERYRLAHEKWPETLEQLVPQYMEYLPIDPFDEKPLRYKRTDHGIMIYSVNEDMRDDGGDLIWPTKPQRIGPDVGFRLLDPDRRGFKIARVPSNQDALVQ